LEQEESIKGALSGLSRKPGQFVHTRRIRQIACKVLRQIICKVTGQVEEKIERAFGQFERGEFLSAEESRADMERRKAEWLAEQRR
jgi:hypothetical protein